MSWNSDLGELKVFLNPVPNVSWNPELDVAYFPFFVQKTEMDLKFPVFMFFQVSRCPTPQDIPPWETRKFPLDENEFNEMLEDMPKGYEQGPVTVEPAANAEVNSAVSRRESLEDENEEGNWNSTLFKIRQL